MTVALVEQGILSQHLIDPEICIRCNTCEATCPVGAITHDDRNYVVRAEQCNGCMDCVSPCPTGAIDNWRKVPLARAYPIAEQLLWDELPAELPPEALAEGADAAQAPPPEDLRQAQAVIAAATRGADGETFRSASWSATVPPWSAAHPYTNLHGPRTPLTATVVGNLNCTEAGFDSETHHIVLDFGSQPFPVLEGQSIAIIPPGTDAQGRPHVARQYSVASARNGERPGYNNLALTVKRVTQDHQGQPVRGVASNYLCDAKIGDRVQVIGPFGHSFLMPNHPQSHIVMICTGTGSAPMRAMTEWRRRLRRSGKFEGGRLMLFFGARTPQELPYFGPLQSLPRDFIDHNLAFSRVAGQPRRYVQDLLRERAADLAALLRDDNAHFYVCGLKSMEEGVVLALRDVAQQAGLDWEQVGARLKREGRLHLETY
ncbi:Benzoyl-CoA oxygenase component A [Delftia tsuruhatensis]|uniref:benzoyl-CoA 2,3-epoxidase subunit BoxA n=1 Tax=Delftia tsuruhatensis TaxID=180282 RepID=UPI001E783C32|nr:benzoyl-CoA 2,3-epoxidase subunit BoxA [Delftia tsuruhatensis]CAB5680481.1 Benzoyl-CoA oxygenase component A [Delftia tsuruhatensis]CAC9675566.1 Benzoyl-CoA oxygenase component A [Delftia tsuruhatensis]